MMTYHEELEQRGVRALGVATATRRARRVRRGRVGRERGVEPRDVGRVQRAHLR